MLGWRGIVPSKAASGDKYKVFFSGGKKRRRGVGVIVREEVAKSVMMCEPISERILIMRLKVAPINVLLVQIYAPNEDEDEEEKDRFYERLDKSRKGVQKRERVRNCDGGFQW